MKGDKLDDILEGALSSYSRDESRPGLETRVLNSIHVGRTRSPRWGTWIVAAPTLACILLLTITFAMKHESIPHPSKPRMIANGPIMTPGHGPVPTEKRQHPFQTTKVRAARLTLPKQKQFPTPTPLTDQERILLVLTVQSPNETAVLLEPESRKRELIHIAEIHIQPLQESGQE